MTTDDTHHDAVVTATYSQRMRVRLEDATQLDARIKGKKLRPVCGDHVKIEAIKNETDWLITSIQTRRNELARPNRKGRKEVLAANLDTVVIVAAVAPLTDWFIVDRYLCAAELMGVDSVLVFNKVDLLEGSNIEIPELAEFRDIGIPVIECSAESGKGIRRLRKQLAGQCSIVVGQSGVGKSSLINAMTDESEQRTAAISGKTGEGRHTTVNSVMIQMGNGSNVIDSPGVRDYAPALDASSDAVAGFREIAAAAQNCRFANCRHLKEPGCAVKAGVDDDEISYRRYESYKRVVILTEQLSEDRY